MMCLSSFCEHCKRIISTNKYARFDRRVTQRTQYSRPACRAHTIARPPHKHIQVQIRMARTPPPSVSRTCPSASQHARLTSLAALCKLARSASADPQSAQHSSALSEASRQLFETTRRHRCCCSPQAAPGDMCSGHMPRKSLQHWDPCHNHQNNHAACQQCSCERVQTEATKVPFSRRVWQAGRAGGARAYRRVERSRNVQNCRARGPA